jgi:DNA helicase-2/ATP-dependent DNA helicase PcrA
MRQAGLSHEQVGFTEALPAQLASIQYALRNDTAPVPRTLAVYITSNHRNRYLPPLAQQVLNTTNPQLEHALSALAADLRAAGSVPTPPLADLVTGAYRKAGISPGQETWTRAADRTRNTLRMLDADHGMATVDTELLRLRNDSPVDGLNLRQHPIQAMNLHQTKGREADTTILLLRPNEFYGYEQEPYPSGSRLLYVVMTRARQRTRLVVPETAHPLWLPLVDACDAAA